MFENLKKRYSRKKSAFKKANQSGTSTALVKKAKKSCDECNFLVWLDEHISGRVTLSNVTQIADEWSEADDDPREEEPGSNDRQKTLFLNNLELRPTLLCQSKKLTNEKVRIKLGRNVRNQKQKKIIWRFIS